MHSRPAVVTGLGIICAAGRNPQQFWNTLLSGRTGISPVTDPAWAVFTGPHAGQVPDSWLDDEDSELDRSARLALVGARQALAQAGVDPHQVAGDRLGIVLGRCQATPASAESGSYSSMHATVDVLAEHFGSTGPRIVISTACAAGGNAIGLARDKILFGDADVVLAGGVDPLLYGTFAGFSGLQALKPGPCSPYSLSDGLNLGEGAAFVVVESLERALARGAVPLAEVAGYGLSADAYHATAPDPTGRGGASAMRRAMADAGLNPTDIDYVNGHGTGTKANDRMERKVMHAVFGERAPSVPTSSIKSFTGHTLGAAGAVEAVASILSLRNSMVPPTIGFDESAVPDEPLDFVPHHARPLAVDVVASNNYAFGGNNVSLVLRTPDEDRRCPTPSRRAVVISGVGPVSAIGVGVAAWAEALREGRSGIESDEAVGGTGVAGAPSLGHRTFADRSLWRHMNSLSRLSIAATRLAWEDCGIPMSKGELNDVGLIFATASGSIESTKGFDDSVAADPGKPAVLSFSNVVLNATGGAVCQTMGLRGPTTTICQGGASASIALECAVETVRSGKAEVMIVLAADEYSASTVRQRVERGELSTSGNVRPYDRDRDGTAPGAAAAAFVIESAEHCASRGGRPYAEVLGCTHVGHAAGESSREHICRGIATAVALTDRPVDLVVGAADGRPNDEHEAAAAQTILPKAMLTAPASVTGDCAAASGAFNIIVAALAVRDGLVPATAALADPAVGAGQDAERFVTGSPRAERVNVGLALTRADASVCGQVLLGEPA